MKSKIIFTLIAIVSILGLQSCDEDPKITLNSNDFAFKAINLTVDDGKLTANGGTPVTVNWTANVTINGETTSLSGSSMSNELPVLAGNELEIQFTPTCPEQTEVYFTLPDGTTRKLTVSEPTFKWIVPEGFVSGMQIKGESHYETDDNIYNMTGVITLITLE